MVAVLVILDGASEPWRGAPTSLERARTPLLDRLAREGELTRLRTIAAGLAAGSETAIPALLGWTPTAPVDRGALEAAAYEILVQEGQRAWRVDVIGPDGAGVLSADAIDRVSAALAAGAGDHEVHRLAGHRLLLVGPPPLPAAARGRTLRAWPEGIVPPELLGPETVLVGARGAAIGTARLMGAATIVPPGATGRSCSDLAAEAAAAIQAIGAGAQRIIVHVGGPDEAAHLRDHAAKVVAIERADRELVGPLVDAVRDAGGEIRVCPDHGCDPATGEHDPSPVPCIDWTPARAAGGATPGRRLTERAVANLPIVELPSAAALVAA